MAAKSRYQYFPVIQKPDAPVFRRAFVFLNQREWTDPNGTFRPAMCLSIEPNGNQMYVVDNEGQHAKEKLAVLNRVVKEGVHPVIGPFETVEEAIVAERQARPMTDAEKIARADAALSEVERLRRENEELKAAKNSR